MTLLMTAPVRLVRAADQVELYAATFEFKSLGSHKFVEWAADEGLALRGEVDRGARSLAGEIVRLLFTPDSNRDGTPVEPSTDQAAPEPQFPVSPRPGEATH